jgi:hypothetical protein
LLAVDNDKLFTYTCCTTQPQGTVMSTRNKKPRKLEVVKPVELPADCCKKCKFHLEETATQVFCRRYPATPVAVKMGVMSCFPTMLNEGWCGEFAPIPVQN